MAFLRSYQIAVSIKCGTFLTKSAGATPINLTPRDLDAARPNLRLLLISKTLMFLAFLMTLRSMESGSITETILQRRTPLSNAWKSESPSQAIGRYSVRSASSLRITLINLENVATCAGEKL